LEFDSTDSHYDASFKIDLEFEPPCSISTHTKINVETHEAVFREGKNYYQIVLERDSTDIVSQSAGATVRGDLAVQIQEKEDKKLTLDLKSKSWYRETNCSVDFK